MDQFKPPYLLIRESLLKGHVIPFLGAGASLSSRAPGVKWEKGDTTFAPTTSELADFLARICEFPQDETRDLTKVTQYLQVIAGRRPLYEQLHDIFDYNFPVTPLHTFLSEIPRSLLIITTNYDDLIERAFDQKGRPFDKIIHTTDASLGDRLLWWPFRSTKPISVPPNKLYIDLNTTTVIYKIHGAIDRLDPSRDQFVVTEDDYIDFLVRMTKNKAIPAIFAEPFQSRHFLFLGYSLSDWNLRVVLNRLEKDLHRSREIKSWAIQRTLKSLEKRFWEERGVEVYEMTNDEFVRELVSRRAFT